MALWFSVNDDEVTGVCKLTKIKFSSFIQFNYESFALKSQQKHASNVSFITKETENPPNSILRTPRRKYANKPCVFYLLRLQETNHLYDLSRALCINTMYLMT